MIYKSIKMKTKAKNEANNKVYLGLMLVMLMEVAYFRADLFLY